MNRTILLLLLLSHSVLSQKSVVHLEVGESPVSESRFDLIVEVTVEKDFHLYGTEAVEGPVPTDVKIDLPSSMSPAGSMVVPSGRKHFDQGFNVEVTWLSGVLQFKQPIAILGRVDANDSLVVTFQYQACTETFCLPPKTITKKYGVSAKIVEAGSGKPVVTPRSESEGKSVTGSKEVSLSDRIDSYENLRKESLASFIGLALLTGFLALLTPCVFPMIPITVSYFTKHSATTRVKAIRQSLIYIFGIVVSFTLFGWVMSLIVGAAGAQNFAANVWVNLGIGALFVLFALSLFGVFEIRLPSFIVNYSQKHSDTGRTVGTLFAGVTFTLVSFTCTVQFLGLLMVASAQGEWFLPVIGMLFFALAFASPFFFLSLFPQVLANMPKSGSWLHATKIVMAFVEVAAAFKFFSNVDLVWDLELLTRQALLSIWIVLFGISGFYLLGKIRFSADDDVDKIGAGRTTAGIFFLSVTIYLIPGLFGHPLQADLDSYLPPAEYGAVKIMRDGEADEKTVWIEDYQEGLAKSREMGKPMFIDFTGKTCTNCRLMEKTMFVRSDVSEMFEDMVLVRLWTDFGDQMEKNQEIQQRLVGSVALPYYVIMDSHEHVHAKFGGLERDPEIFKAFLSAGLSKDKAESLNGLR